MILTTTEAFVGRSNVLRALPLSVQKCFALYIIDRRVKIAGWIIPYLRSYCGFYVLSNQIDRDQTEEVSSLHSMLNEILSSTF